MRIDPTPRPSISDAPPQAAAVATPPGAPRVEGDRLELSPSVRLDPKKLGPDHFLLGANLPWIQYGDFGANAWHPQGGLSDPEQREKLDQALTRMTAEGITHTRWFMLVDGRSGIRFGQDGTPQGLDPTFFKDVDTALAAAKQHGIHLTFSLLDFGWIKQSKGLEGVPAGGHADVLRDPKKRQALMDNVLKPIFERYGHDPTIEAWDVFNEPEWVTLFHGTVNPFQSVSAGTMRAYLGEAVSYVHRYTDQAATVGSASTRWLDLVKGLGLDFYQAHWYDSTQKLSRLEKPVARFELDRPLVLGEFPTQGTERSPSQIMDAAKKAGFSGAMTWSVLGSDKVSGPDGGLAAVHDWARDHAASLYEPPH